MQPFDRSGRYGDAAVLAQLRGAQGGRRIDFRYELLDRSNYKKADLVGVMSGSIQQDSTADIKRTATFTLREGLDSIDYLQDRIKPWVRLQMPDGLWVEWQQGVFLLSSPSRVLSTSRTVTRTVQAYDQLVVLSSDAVTDRYSIPAGLPFSTAINAIVAGLISGIRLTPTTAVLPVTWDYEPGTSKLTILNDLLSALNYRSAYFDEDGVLVCEPYVLPQNRPIGYTYATDSTSTITGEIGDDIDLFSIPNKWTLVVSDTDQGSFSSTFTNTDPASPTSTVSRGRTIVSFQDGQTAADQATLDALVRTTAYADSQLYSTVPFTTVIMPFHSNGDIIGLTVPDLGYSTPTLFEELSWSMDLTVGASMSHQLRRSVSV